MTRTALIPVSLVLAGLALAPLGGCVGAPGPLAYRTEPGPRVVRVPATLTGTQSQVSTLILGIQ